jgi:hypothetical protein
MPQLPASPAAPLGRKRRAARLGQDATWSIAAAQSASSTARPFRQMARYPSASASVS